MSETKPPRALPWGLTTRWLLVAGAALVVAAVITTFALRLLNPEPQVPTPTIEPSPVDVQPLPTDQGTFELPTELSTLIELPTELFTIIQLPTEGAPAGGSSDPGLPR